MEKKFLCEQTAVEWFLQKLKEDERIWEDWRGIDEIFKKAIEMEKQQIVNAVDGFPLHKRNLCGEDYYAEIYGKN